MWRQGHGAVWRADADVMATHTDEWLHALLD